MMSTLRREVQRTRHRPAEKENTRSAEVRFARAEQYALATVAFVLTDAMESSGLSQRRLAQQLGVTEARISQVLNATGNPPIKSLARFADALKCKLKVEFARVAAAAEDQPSHHALMQRTPIRRDRAEALARIESVRADSCAIMARACEAFA